MRFRSPANCYFCPLTKTLNNFIYALEYTRANRCSNDDEAAAARARARYTAITRSEKRTDENALKHSERVARDASARARKRRVTLCATTMSLRDVRAPIFSCHLLGKRRHDATALETSRTNLMNRRAPSSSECDAKPRADGHKRCIFRWRFDFALNGKSWHLNARARESEQQRGLRR